MPTHPPIDPELKTRVIQACLVPGAKMATVAHAGVLACKLRIENKKVELTKKIA